MKTSIWKRSAAWLLCLVLMLGVVPSVSNVVADGAQATEEWVIYRPGTGTALATETMVGVSSETNTTFTVSANAELNFFRDNMELTIPDTLGMDDLALHMRIYVSNASMLNVGQIELSNSTRDKTEVAWLLESVSFVAGWNDLVLPLNGITTSSGDFDLHSPIRWFRFYSETHSSTNEQIVVENISLTLTESGMRFGLSDSYVALSKPLPQAPATIEANIKMDVPATEWVISNCDGKDGLYNSYESEESKLTADTLPDGTPYVRINVKAGNKASIRCKNLGLITPKGHTRADLALSMRVYIDDISKLPSTELEVTSDTNDSMEISWKSKNLDWHSGWNEVLLPFSTAHDESDTPFDLRYINYFRWTFSSVFAADAELGLADIKIVSLLDKETQQEDGAWRISHCTGNDNLVETGGATVSFGTDGELPYVRAISNGSALNISKSGMDIYIPEEYEWSNLVLSMQVYVSDPAQLTRWRLELASNMQNADEIQWTMNDYAWQTGWNTVELPLDTFTAQSGQFTTGGIRWFRFYSSFTLAKGTEVRVADVKIVPLVEVEIQGDRRESDAFTHMIFSNTNSSDEHPYAFLITKDGYPSVIWDDRQVTFDYYVFTGEWIHLAVVRDMAQKAFILYVNGEEQGRASAAGTREIYPTTVHHIGSDGAGVDGGTFCGLLGDVRVWSRARTAQQIADNMVDMTCSRMNGFDETTKWLMGGWFLRGDLEYIFGSVEDVSAYQNVGYIRGSRADDWLDYEKPAFCEEPGSYTIAVLPDIQELTAKYPAVWHKMAEWIRDNAEKENIQHVIGVGDSTYNNSAAEWAAARAGYDMFMDKVTYTNILGNHDYGDWSNPWRDTSMYNRYFSYTDAMENNPSLTGVFREGEMDNAYYTFTVNDIPYLVLQLEFRPRTAVLEWANRVLDAYPNHNVIVTVHGYMNGKGQVMTHEIEGHEGEYVFTEADSADGMSQNGQQIWDELIATHDNVRLVLCGHKHSENIVWRRDYTNNGTPVYQMLLCAQDLDRDYFTGTGVGLVALMHFSADGTKMAINYYAPYYDKSFREVNQLEFDLNVLKGEYETAPTPVEPVHRCEHAVKVKRVTTEATCTEPGVKTTLCSACGEVFDTEDVSAKGHKPGGWVESKETSCKESGLKEQACTVCGEVLDTEEIPVLNHEYGQWIIDEIPTILKEGSQHRECGKCGDTETQAIEKLSFLTGDVDGDDEITSTDARLILQHTAGKVTLTEEQLVVADTDGDGEVTTTDARLTLQEAVGRL